MMLGRHNSSEWKTVIQELTLHKEEVEQLREELNEVKLNFKQELEALKDQVLTLSIITVGIRIPDTQIPVLSENCTFQLPIFEW